MHNDASPRGDLVDDFRLATLDNTEMSTNAIRRVDKAREQRAPHTTDRRGK
jgi:hypothetical protein